VSNPKRQPGLQIGNKMFWFNVQTARTGAKYLSIVGDVKGNKEKLTLFPNQIPSFIHMVRSSYTEIVKEMGLEDFVTEMPTTPPEKPADALLSECPNCGADGSTPQIPDVSLKNNGDLVSVQCIDGCGYKWPEGEAVWGSMNEARKIWEQDWLIEVFKKNG